MSSTWFRRNKKGILTSTEEKKETPDGLWHKCPECKATTTVKDLHDNLYVCHQCNYHNRINSKEYFEILFDNNDYELLFENIVPKDMLGFVDMKPYGARLVEAQKSTSLKDAMTVGTGSGQALSPVCSQWHFEGVCLRGRQATYTAVLEALFACEQGRDGL